MSSHQQRILTADKIVTVTTTVRTENRVVDFSEIKTSVSVDDWMTEAPWEHCDGWEHEAEQHGSKSDFALYDTIGGNISELQGFGYSVNNREYFLITIDDDTVANRWGCNGYPGASKQVVRESIAEAKRAAIKQLVEWYENGWEWYNADAEYGEFQDSLGGIDSYDYAQECADECARNVAHEMEQAGYVVENIPPAKQYSRVEMMRDQIHRNLGYVA